MPCFVSTSEGDGMRKRRSSVFHRWRWRRASPQCGAGRRTKDRSRCPYTRTRPSDRGRTYGSVRARSRAPRFCTEEIRAARARRIRARRRRSPAHKRGTSRKLPTCGSARVAFIVATSVCWYASERALREDIDTTAWTVHVRATKRRSRLLTIPVTAHDQM